jgi:2-iminobutanoate/2-iminopropanoate deaminase
MKRAAPIVGAALRKAKEEIMIQFASAARAITIGAIFATLLSSASMGKDCYAPDSLAQRRAFSRAVTTEGGKLIWLGGQTGAPNTDFEGQVRQIFSELDKNIKAAGGRGLEDMVTMTVFITDVRNGDRLTEIRKEIFKECFPASALITVSALAAPGLLIEIQGIAVSGGK